jgi:hypothetical protein
VDLPLRRLRRCQRRRADGRDGLRGGGGIGGGDAQRLALHHSVRRLLCRRARHRELTLDAGTVAAEVPHLKIIQPSKGMISQTRSQNCASRADGTCKKVQEKPDIGMNCPGTSPVTHRPKPATGTSRPQWRIAVHAGQLDVDTDALLGFDRIVASEKESPNMLVNLV